jgi:hypothetical protein
MTNKAEILDIYILSWYQSFARTQQAQAHDENERDHEPLKHIYKFWERVSPSSLFSRQSENLQWPRVHYVAHTFEDLEWLVATFPSFNGILEYANMSLPSHDFSPLARHEKISANRLSLEQLQNRIDLLQRLDHIQRLIVRMVTKQWSMLRAQTKKLNRILPKHVQTIHYEIEKVSPRACYILWQQLPYRCRLKNVSLGKGVLPGYSFFDAGNSIESFCLYETSNELPDMSRIRDTLTGISLNNAFYQPTLYFFPALEEVTLRMTKTPCGLKNAPRDTGILQNNPHIKHCHIVCHALDLPVSTVIQNVLSYVRQSLRTLCLCISFCIPKGVHAEHYMNYGMDFLSPILAEFERSYFPLLNSLSIVLKCQNINKITNYSAVYIMDKIRPPQLNRWLIPLPQLQKIECEAYPYVTWQEKEETYDHDNTSMTYFFPSSSPVSVRIHGKYLHRSSVRQLYQSGIEFT